MSDRGAELDPVTVWRTVIVGDRKSWVLFRQGTCVIFVDPPPGTDLADAARELLAEWGPVQAGSSAGDFSVITLPDGLGWAVTCHHPDVLTWVPPEEGGPDPAASGIGIGLLGRGRRGQDGEELAVVHVEDRR